MAGEHAAWVCRSCGMRGGPGDLGCCPSPAYEELPDIDDDDWSGDCACWPEGWLLECVAGEPCPDNVSPAAAARWLEVSRG